MRNIPALPHLRPLAAALALAGVLTGTPPATATHMALHPGDSPERRDPIIITNCDDAGPGSLREAYANAIDGEQIDVGQLACSTITLTTGALVDDASANFVAIRGPAPASGRTLAIRGNHADRIFVHNGGDRLSLSWLLIEAGRSNAGKGGCVYSHGGVFASDSRFFDCTVYGAQAQGGAIFAGGDVYLSGSSIVASSAHGSDTASGGAIHSQHDVRLRDSMLKTNLAMAVSGNIRTGSGGGVFAAANAMIGYSTLIDNHSAFGGGVHASSVTLYDSTVSGNRADGWGGGVLAGSGPNTIANSTIAFNRNGAGAGAGMYLNGQAHVDSTIIAGNSTGDSGTPTDVAGKTGAVVGANNLILASDLPIPPDTITTDPMLDPLLQDNGGLTPTHALLPGSPAIDHGSNPLALCCDQRHRRPGTAYPFERIVGAAADIGALEVGAADRIFVNGFEVEVRR
jgi:hypothetical protein